MAVLVVVGVRVGVAVEVGVGVGVLVGVWVGCFSTSGIKSLTLVGVGVRVEVPVGVGVLVQVGVGVLVGEQVGVKVPVISRTERVIGTVWVIGTNMEPLTTSPTPTSERSYSLGNTHPALTNAAAGALGGAGFGTNATSRPACKPSMYRLTWSVKVSDPVM